ncbi:RelA/SpoT [Penicillium herquei]|nr:RelA/SpoT [Penicillium herquei]
MPEPRWIYSFETILTENEKFPSASEMQIFLKYLLHENDRQWNIENLSFLHFETFHAFLISQDLNTPVSLERLVQNSKLSDRTRFESIFGEFQDKYSPLQVNALLYLMDETFLDSRKEYEVQCPEQEPETKTKMLMSAILWSKDVFPCRGGATWRELFVGFPSDTLKWDLTWLSKTRTRSILRGTKKWKDQDLEPLDNLWEWFYHDDQGPPVKFVFDMAFFGMERDGLSEGETLGNEIDSIKKVLRVHEGLGG